MVGPLGGGYGGYPLQVSKLIMIIDLREGGPQVGRGSPTVTSLRQDRPVNP